MTIIEDETIIIIVNMTTEAYALQDGTIKLVLDGKEDTRSYIIYRAEEKDGDYKEIARTRKSRFKDKNTKTYQNYYYKTASAEKKERHLYYGKALQSRPCKSKEAG